MPGERTLGDVVCSPIVLNELRSRFRQKKFFYLLLGFVGLFAVCLLGALAVAHAGADASKLRPSEIGGEIFTGFLVFLLGVAVFVFPSFGCTSLVAERERHTLESLLATGISPFEVVWGKFLACLCYVVIYVTSLSPLATVGILYGGTDLLELCAGLLLIFAASSSICIFALWISAKARTARQAVLITYVPLMLLGLTCLCPCTWATFLPALISNARTPSGIVHVALARFGVFVPTLSLWEGVLLLGLGPLFLVAAYFTLFYLLSVNELQPTWANRATPLRLFYAVFLLLGAPLGLSLVLHYGGSAVPGDRWRYGAQAWFCLLGAALLALPLACQDVRVREAVVRRLADLRGWRHAVRLMYPGHRTGAAFLLAANALVGTAFVVGLGLGLPMGSVSSWARGGASLVVVLGTLALLAGLGALLAAREKMAGWRHWVVWGLAALLLVAIPVAGAVASQAEDSVRPFLPWTSPLLALGAAWGPGELPDVVGPAFVLGVVLGVLGMALLAGAQPAARRAV